MNTNNQPLNFFLDLSIIQSKFSKAMDLGLGQGIGFNDFRILYHLDNSTDGKMRAIDLAEKISMTQSGITRMVLPMEKIGLISREDSDQDGRVKYVKIAPGGKRILQDSLERAALISEKFLPSMDISSYKNINEIFSIFPFVI